MVWKAKPRRDADYKEKTKFLLIPRRCNGYWHWLEWCELCYHGTYTSQGIIWDLSEINRLN